MHIFVFGSVGLSLAALLFVIIRHLVRLLRSYTLTWPRSAGQREQARICRAHLARAGIVCQGLMLHARVFDLVYRTPHNTIHIVFASPYHGVTVSVLRDMNGAVSTDSKKIPVLIAHPKFVTQEAIALARDAKIPLLRSTEIPALRDLIKAGRQIKRQDVLKLSGNAFDPPRKSDQTETLARATGAAPNG
jgi:hypothetical protein